MYYLKALKIYVWLFNFCSSGNGNISTRIKKKPLLIYNYRDIQKQEHTKLKLIIQNICDEKWFILFLNVIYQFTPKLSMQSYGMLPDSPIDAEDLLARTHL